MEPLSGVKSADAGPALTQKRLRTSKRTAGGGKREKGEKRRRMKMLEVEEKYQVRADERYMKLKDSVQAKADDIRQLREDAKDLDQKAQLLIEESMRKKAEYDIGAETSYEAVQEAFDTARKAGEAAKEAKNNLEQAIKEHRVKQGMLAMEGETVSMRIAAEIRQEHRAAVKKLTVALGKAAKVNAEILNLEHAFRQVRSYASWARNGKLERELGYLPGFGIRELMNFAFNPDGTRNKGVNFSEYERWLKRVREYGYLED